MDGTTPSPLPPDTSRATLLLVVLWITLGPALTLTCMRMYTKVRIKHQIHWDDYLICLASALSVCGAALNHLQVKSGFGRHIYYLTDDQISHVLKWSTLVEMVNEIAVFFVKTSICLFILRMLSGTHKTVRLFVWATIAIFFVITAVAVITLGVQCIPFQGVWDKSLHPKCISSKVVTQITKAYGVLSVITDFTTASVPISILQSLQMSLRTKIGLCIIMGLGFLTAATSIGKTVTTNFVTEDITRDLVTVEIWSILELQLGIIVASAPALRQLFVWSQQQRSTRRMRNSQDHTSEHRASQPTTIAYPSATHSKGNKTSISNENLIPLESLPVRKTTDVEVDYSNRTESDHRLESGTSWD